MKQICNLKNLTISLFAIVFFASCSNDSEQAKLIPADALVVGIVDVPAIGLKSKLYDKNAFAMIEDVLKSVESGSEGAGVILRGLLKENSETGISVLSPMYFFTTIDKSQNANTCLVVALTDAGKFADKLEDELSDAYTTEKLPEYTYYSNESNTWIAFDENSAIFIVNDGVYHKQKSEEFIANLFSLTEETSILSNKKFKPFSENATDISVLVSGSAVLANIDSDASKEIQKRISLVKNLNINYLNDSYLIANLLFEDDNINLTFSVDPSEGLQNFMNEASYTKDKFYDDVYSYIPKETQFLGAMAFSSEKLQSYLKTFDLYSQIEIGLKAQQINPDELFEALGGEILFSLYDVSIETQPKTTYDYEFNPVTQQFEGIEKEIMDEVFIPKASLVMSINNKTFLDKIFKNVIPAGTLEAIGDYYKIPNLGLDFPLFVGYNNDVLLVSTDENAMAEFQNEGYDESFANTELAQEISPAGFYYLNLNYDTYPSDIKEYVNKLGMLADMIVKNYGIFNSIVIAAEEKNSVKLQLDLKSSDENSLYQVLKIIDNTPKSGL